jgi:hypothetical protein
MEVIFAMIWLLTFVYAGIISIASAEYQRLTNPVNLFLLLIGMALLFVGLFGSVHIFYGKLPFF